MVCEFVSWDDEIPWNSQLIWKSESHVPNHQADLCPSVSFCAHFIRTSPSKGMRNVTQDQCVAACQLTMATCRVGHKDRRICPHQEKNEIQRESSITNQLSISINHHSSFSAVTSLQQSNLDQSRRAPKRWCDRFIITRCVPKHGVQMFSGLPFALASLISRLPPGLRPPGPALWERRLQRRRHHPADPHRVPGQAATNHQRVPWTAQLAAGSGMVMMVMKWWLVKLLWIVFAAIYKCTEIYWTGGWWWWWWWW